MKKTVYDVRKCGLCGKEFEITNKHQLAKKYCSPECGRKANRILTMEKYKSIEKIVPKRKKDINYELACIAVEARQHGMSYGKYVSQEYMKKQNWRS